MDIAKHNQQAWDKLVRDGNRWTQPVSSEVIANARQGKWQVVLTPRRAVPGDWFGELQGKRVLCLASGGGQQGPVLAAAGADVTVFDNSPAQLQQDQQVAEREGLNLQCLQGDMRDLSVLKDSSFDLVFHPCSNGFIPDVNPVWRECFRVLTNGGRLMTGFVNPLFYLFDFWEMQKRRLVVKYRIPFSDQEQLPAAKLQELKDQGEPLEYGHSLSDQIGGQLRAGFRLIGFFEDVWDDPPGDLLSEYIHPMVATLAYKPDPAAD